MGKKNILDEIMHEASQIPIERQERILDILRGMDFTKKQIANKEKANSFDTKDTS